MRSLQTVAVIAAIGLLAGVGLALGQQATQFSDDFSGYAAGSDTEGEGPEGFDAAFVLKSEGGQWVNVYGTPECSKAPDPLNRFCNVS